MYLEEISDKLIEENLELNDSLKIQNQMPWVDAEKWLPQGPHEVLATDGEGWFVACYDGVWKSHEMEEPIDSEITHWMEPPDPPEL